MTSERATPEPSAAAQPSDERVRFPALEKNMAHWSATDESYASRSAASEGKGASGAEEALLEELRACPDLLAERAADEIASLRADRDRLERELEEARRERDAAREIRNKWASRAIGVKAENRRLRDALEKRRRAGHNDTCSAALVTDPQPTPDEHEACSCGHSAIVRALHAPESEGGDGR